MLGCQKIKEVLALFLIFLVVSSLGCAAPTSVKKRDFVQQHGVLSSFDDLKNCGYDEELIALIQSFSELDAGFDQSLAAGVAVKISSGLERRT
jgi:hypothetical protein